MSLRIPRLEMEQLDPKLKETLRARVERLGYLGEFFKCTGHSPDVLRHFMELTEALKKAVPDRITETVALTVAVKTENDYERNQHERLCIKLGFGHEWVRSVEMLDPGNQKLMSESERIVQSYTLAAIKRMGNNCENEFEKVLDVLEVSEAVGVLMLVGRYLTHAVAVNTLGLMPPKSSIFEEENNV
jgi:hypothetical protein